MRVSVMRGNVVPAQVLDFALAQGFHVLKINQTHALGRFIHHPEYAISDEEYIAQAVSIAVAINDTQGRYIGSLYTTAPKTRKSLEDLIGFVPDMQKAADDIRDAFFGEI